MDPISRVVRTGGKQMFDRKGPDSLLFDLGSVAPHWSDWLWSWRSGSKEWRTTDSEFIFSSADGQKTVDMRGSVGRGKMWTPGLFQHIGDVSEYRNAEIKGRLKSWSFEVGMKEAERRRKGL